MKYHYVWRAWSSAFLIPWIAVYAAYPRLRTNMLRASAITALFGITEPLLVPAYWNPPSLFELAQRTRFDIESFILIRDRHVLEHTVRTVDVVRTRALRSTRTIALLRGSQSRVCLSVLLV